MKSGATLSEAAQMARDQESHERQIMRALEREETCKAQLEQDRQTAELTKQEQDRIARLEIEKEKLAIEKSRHEAELANSAVWRSCSNCALRVSSSSKALICLS